MPSCRLSKHVIVYSKLLGCLQVSLSTKALEGTGVACSALCTECIFADRHRRARCAVPVLGRFRVSLEHPTLDALDLGGAQTGLAPGADGQLLLNVVNLRVVVLAGFSYKRTSFPVRSVLRR